MIYFGGFRKRSSGEKYEYANLDDGQGLYNKNGDNVSLVYYGTEVPANAFKSSPVLRVVFGKKITSIDTGSFHSCSSLTQVSLPKATSIGSYTLQDCPKLKKIICKQGMRSRIQQVIQESYLTQSIEIIEV